MNILEGCGKTKVHPGIRFIPNYGYVPIPFGPRQQQPQESLGQLPVCTPGLLLEIPQGYFVQRMFLPAPMFPLWTTARYYQVQATLKIYSGAKPNKVQHSPPLEHFQHQSKSIAYCFSCKVTLPI